MGPPGHTRGAAARCVAPMGPRGSPKRAHAHSSLDAGLVARAWGTPRNGLGRSAIISATAQELEVLYDLSEAGPIPRKMSTAP